MEVVRIATGDYERYEELLLQRDQLEKEGENYRRAYFREFGDLVTELFRLKVECIGIKKAITYCQTKRNRGEIISPEGMQDYLTTHMAAYYQQLNELLDQQLEANSGKPISPGEVAEIKRIYRRLAKLLHPDISPLTRENPELMELFQQVIAAYRCNALQRLQELDVLIAKALKDLGTEQVNLVIPDVEERMEKLEEEISRILTTEPYTYRELLADAFRMEEKKKELEDEIRQYTDYRTELQTYLDSFHLPPSP